MSLLQEERLFASRLSRCAVFVAFWHLICLLFLGTCFVSIVVAVYVLALRLFRFLLLLSLHFVPCLSVRSFKISILIKRSFAAVLKVWHRGTSALPAFPARTWLNLLMYDRVADLF